MSEHPKLKNSPLVETVFELRFDPKNDYGLFLAQIFSTLKNDFPIAETLAPFDIPDFADGPKLLRNCFKRKDGTALIQLGHGIVSINQSKYDRFNSFLSLIKKVIKEVENVEPNPNIQRLGLRYINKIPFTNDPSEILVMEIKLPTVIKDKLEAFTYRFRINENSAGKLRLVIANLIKNDVPTKEMTIDLDHYLLISHSIEIGEIEKWINEAHENIYNCFISCIKEEYLEKIK